MSRDHIQLTPELSDYLRRVSLHEPDVLARLREDTAKMENGEMQITPEQGQFMRLLVRLLRVRKALEIGTFTGYSSTAVALGLPADGRLICCDVSEEYTARAREAWREAGVESRIELRIGPAVQTLEAMIANGDSGTFDFAFIDADKPNYGAYLDRVYKLLRTGGLALIDNVLWSGRVIDPGVNDVGTTAIRQFNTKLKDDPRFTVSMLPLGDGVTLAMKN